MYEDLSELCIREHLTPNAIATATKAIITLGPACQDVEVLCQLLEAGAVCARCDLSWGSLQYHAQSLSNLQAAMRQTQKLCAVLVETMGREILANCKLDGVTARTAIYRQRLVTHQQDEVVLTSRDVGDVFHNGDSDSHSKKSVLLPVSQRSFPSSCSKGETIVLSEYLSAGRQNACLYLTVAEVTDTDVVCIARSDAQLNGVLSVFPVGRKPSEEEHDQPVLCDQDLASLTQLARDFEIDFLSLSFTEHARDISLAQNFLASVGLEKTQVFAKLNSGRALSNLHQILEQADGIILSRGDLRLDMNHDRFSSVQKAITVKCNVAGKPVVVTRLLDSMLYASTPSRAEVTDLTAAVLDGCDAIMLGAQTASGRNPVAVLNKAFKICQEAEIGFDSQEHFAKIQEALSSNNGMEFAALDRVAQSALQLVDTSNAKLIVTISHSEMGISMLTKYRPKIPVLAVLVPSRISKVEAKSTARHCLIHRGLLPVLAKPSSLGASVLEYAVSTCIRNGMLNATDQILIVRKAQEGFVAEAFEAGDLSNDHEDEQDHDYAKQENLLQAGRENGKRRAQNADLIEGTRGSGKYAEHHRDTEESSLLGGARRSGKYISSETEVQKNSLLGKSRRSGKLANNIGSNDVSVLLSSARTSGRLHNGAREADREAQSNSLLGNPRKSGKLADDIGSKDDSALLGNARKSGHLHNGGREAQSNSLLDNPRRSGKLADDIGSKDDNVLLGDARKSGNLQNGDREGNNRSLLGSARRSSQLAHEPGKSLSLGEQRKFEGLPSVDREEQTNHMQSTAHRSDKFNQVFSQDENNALLGNARKSVNFEDGNIEQHSNTVLGTRSSGKLARSYSRDEDKAGRLARSYSRDEDKALLNNRRKSGTSQSGRGGEQSNALIDHVRVSDITQSTAKDAGKIPNGDGTSALHPTATQQGNAQQGSFAADREGTADYPEYSEQGYRNPQQSSLPTKAVANGHGRSPFNRENAPELLDTFGTRDQNQCPNQQGPLEQDAIERPQPIRHGSEMVAQPLQSGLRPAISPFHDRYSEQPMGRYRSEQFPEARKQQNFGQMSSGNPAHVHMAGEELAQGLPPSRKVDRSGRDSVPALVERAREVINRRMEQAQGMNRQSSYQRMSYPMGLGQADTNLERAATRAPSLQSVRGPDTPDLREQATRESQRYAGRQQRTGQSRMADAFGQVLRPEQPSRSLDSDTVGDPRNRIAGIDSTERVRQFVHAASASSAHRAAPDNQIQRQQRGERLQDHSQVVQAVVPQSVSNVQLQKVRPALVDSHFQSPDRLPRQPSQGVQKGIRQPFHKEAGRPVSVQQAREILGTISRSPSRPISRSPSINQLQYTAASAGQEYSPTMGDRPMMLRDRSQSSLDKYPRDWYAQHLLNQGRQPWTAGPSSHTSQTPSSGSYQGPPGWQPRAEYEPQQGEKAQHQQKIQNEEDKSRAAQASQAARVLHQAGLNLLHQASLTESEMGKLSMDMAKTSRRNGYPPLQKLAGTQGGQYSGAPSRSLTFPSLPDGSLDGMQAPVWRKLPRVVGGKVVPGLSGPTQASRGRGSARKWNPSAPAIPESASIVDPAQVMQGLPPVENFGGLRSPAAQTMPVSEIAKQRGRAKEDSRRRRAKAYHASTVDDLAVQRSPAQNCSRSIMSSTPDIYLEDQQQDPEVHKSKHVGSLESAAPAVQSGRPLQSATHNGQDSSTAISRQPSVAYESGSLPGSQTLAAAPQEIPIINSSTENARILPVSDTNASNDKTANNKASSAEEVMRDYLVGEGIKKAHFRALHPKAPKKKKNSFFASIFGRASKD